MRYVCKVHFTFHLFTRLYQHIDGKNYEVSGAILMLPNFDWH